MELSGLIAGLGNPGKEYKSTRHNYGFMAIAMLLAQCEAHGFIRKLSGQKTPYNLWRHTFSRKIPERPAQGDWLLMTPLSFMNRSGEPVQQVSAYYGIAPERILVLHDELDLPFGRLKLKKGGGNAGHNGLKSIQQTLGTPDFYRLRLGIGRPPQGRDAVPYVLGRFSAEQKEALPAMLEAACAGILLFMQGDIKRAQELCNGFVLALPSADE